MFNRVGVGGSEKFMIISEKSNENAEMKTGQYNMSYDDEYLLSVDVRTAGTGSLVHTIESGDAEAVITEVFNDLDPVAEKNANPRLRVSLWHIKSKAGATITFGAGGTYVAWKYFRFKAKGFIGKDNNTDANVRTGTFATEYSEEYLFLANIRTVGEGAIKHTVTSNDASAEIEDLFNSTHLLTNATRLSLWKIKGAVGSTITISATGNYSAWEYCRIKA